MSSSLHTTQLKQKYTIAFTDMSRVATPLRKGVWPCETTRHAGRYNSCFSAHTKTNYSQELIVVFLNAPRRVVSSTHVRAFRVSAFLQQHMALPVRLLLVDGVISFLRLLMSLPFSCEPSTHLLSPDWTAVCTDTKSVDGSKLIRSFFSIYFRETSFDKRVREEVSAVFPFEAVTTLTRLRIRLPSIV